MASPAAGGKVDFGCTEDWSPACPQLSRCPRRLACRAFTQLTTLSRPRVGTQGKGSDSAVLPCSRPGYLATRNAHRMTKVLSWAGSPGQWPGGLGRMLTKGGAVPKTPTGTLWVCHPASLLPGQGWLSHLPRPMPPLSLQLLPLLRAPCAPLSLVSGSSNDWLVLR